MAKAAWLLAAFALAGCLRVGPGDDVHLVCEEKGNTPGAGYSLVDLVDITQVVNATLTEQEERAILTPAQPHVITLAKRHHADPSATLAPLEGTKGWRFTFEGTWNGTVRDEYEVILQEGEVYAPSATIERIPLPASVLAEAQRVVAREEGLDDVRARTPRLAGSGYDPALPGCARLLYAEPLAGNETDAAATERPHTFVTVNLGQGRVVDVQRELSG